MIKNKVKKFSIIYFIVSLSVCSEFVYSEDAERGGTERELNDEKKVEKELKEGSARRGIRYHLL